MELHGKHLLGNETSAKGDERFHGFDPSTGERLDPAYVETTQAEVDHAMALADDAFGPFRQAGRQARAKLLEDIAARLEALGDPLLERASLETGLPIARFTMERGRTVGQLRMFADIAREGDYLDIHIDRAEPDRKPIPKPDLRRMLQPVGPVVVFGASNFPLAFSVPGGDTASALAAGCPVVVKAHPAHPGTSEMVGRTIVDAVAAAGLPPGVFSMVHGATPAVGAMLVEHPSAKAVGFTGSLRGGRALFDLAARRPEPIPVYAEMGSINPVVFLPDALATQGEDLARGLCQSVALGVGQFCTSPGLVLLIDEPEPVSGFLHAMAEALDAASPATMLHEGIKAAFDQGVREIASVEGVEPIGTIPEGGGRASRAVAFTVDATTFLSNPRLQEEVFGPSTIVVRCADRDELERAAGNLPGQLTATIHGSESDLEQSAGLVDLLTERAGRVVFGSFPTGVEVCGAMQHGGPYPATTDARTTSVGAAAIQRFLRPVCYQDFPPALLPEELRDPE